MAKGTKTGGRLKGTPNKLTKEIRVVLKKIMAEELKSIPEILNSLEPRERLELLIKLMPYVLPKIQSVNHTTGEPFDFDVFG